MIESVGIFAVLYPKPGREDELIAMLRDLGRATQGSPYCCAEYQIVKHKTIAGEFKILAFEKFTDEAAHAAHRESRHFKSFMKRVEERAMLEKPIEIIGGPVVGGFAVEDVSF